MARGVHERHGAVLPQRKHRLFGKDGDAALAFQCVRVQKRVPVIHAPELADTAGEVQQRFR